MKNFEFNKNNFDLIRLLAALQVAFTHGVTHFEIEGYSLAVDFLSVLPGVPIFFVVSGFLISASLERSSSISSYVKNRLLRIYPALWFCFALSIITIFVFFDPTFTSFDFLKWCLAQISIGQFYNPDFLRGYGVGVLNGSLWTIPVELQFYIVLPIIYALLKSTKKNNVILILLILSLAIINTFYTNSLSNDKSLLLKLFGVTVIPYLYMFLFGVILQKNLWFVSRYLKNNALFIAIIYLASMLLFSKLGINYQGSYLNPISALLLSLLTISLAYSYVGKLSNILKGNDISYGIYIYHMVILNVLVEKSFLSPIENQFLMLFSTILIALFSWRIIEKPALSLKNKSIRANNKITVTQSANHQ